MVEIYLLEQLVAFARKGTLSSAAEELHISQPALSRSMKKLEGEFGVPLFDRSKSKIALNETGKTAARYAEKVLEADREMIERTITFDRSRRTIALGSCAFLPANSLLPLLHEYYSKMAVITEITDDSRLISGLKTHVYQLAILHEPVEDEKICCRKYMDEHLAVTLPADHVLASKKTLTFQDLSGFSILAHGGSGVWLDICRRNLKDAKLLVQDSMDMLSELVHASSLPVFNSDRAMKSSDMSDRRITVPITDKAAHITYYLACLTEEKEKYSGVLRQFRGQLKN